MSGSVLVMDLLVGYEKQKRTKVLSAKGFSWNNGRAVWVRFRILNKLTSKGVAVSNASMQTGEVMVKLSWMWVEGWDKVIEKMWCLSVWRVSWAFMFSYEYWWSVSEERIQSSELLLFVTFEKSSLPRWINLSWRCMELKIILNRKSYGLVFLVAREYQLTLVKSRARIWNW